MYHSIASAVFLLLVSISFCHHLFADESVIMLASPPSNITFLDPNGFNMTSRVVQKEPHTFTIKKVAEPASSSRVNYFITVQPPSVSGFRKAYNGSNYVNYQLYTANTISDSKIVYDKDDLNSSIGGSFNNNHSIRGSVRNTPVQDTFYVHVPDNSHNSTIPPGIYSENVSFTLWRGNASNTFGTNRRNEIHNMQIRIPVQEIQSVDIFFEEGVSYSKNATLSFGALEPDTQVSLRIRYVSNSRTNIYLSSQNGALLIHESRPSQQVGYTIRYGSTTLTNVLPGVPIRVARNIGQQPNGASKMLRFILPSSIPFVSAGNYTDVITVSIESL